MAHLLTLRIRLPNTNDDADGRAAAREWLKGSGVNLEDLDVMHEDGEIEIKLQRIFPSSPPRPVALGSLLDPKEDQNNKEEPDGS